VSGFWRDLVGKITRRAPEPLGFIPPENSDPTQRTQREISMGKADSKRKKENRKQRKRIQASRRKNRGAKRKT
jgi:hypothetical protein